MTPLTRLHHSIFTEKNIQVWIKREELNHPVIQGNKLYKLQQNLSYAKQHKKSPLISFGGPFSNHIAALAAAGKEFQVPTIGFIRGDELKNHPEKWSHTLVTAEDNGMQLQFLDRQTYRQKDQANFQNQLKATYPNGYILPEGGTNVLAIQGFKPLTEELEQQINWDYLFCAVGTGGTLAGLIQNSQYQNKRQLIGIASLKGAKFLNQAVEQWLDTAKPLNDWQIELDFHGGGYGKTNHEIKACQNWFESEFKIQLDPVYNNKMVFAFMQMLQQGRVKQGAKVVLLHTGGLQGNPTSRL